MIPYWGNHGDFAYLPISWCCELGLVQAGWLSLVLSEWSDYAKSPLCPIVVDIGLLKEWTMLTEAKQIEIMKNLKRISVLDSFKFIDYKKYQVWPNWKKIRELKDAAYSKLYTAGQ